MRNGQCPRCNSTTIYQKSEGLYFGDVKGYFSIDGNGTPYVSFICTTCGYFENYVADEKRLEAIANSWQKVPTPTH
jgi:predicted nucleic-acid-binding Zn-ribbon protein